MVYYNTLYIHCIVENLQFFYVPLTEVAQWLKRQQQHSLVNRTPIERFRNLDSTTDAIPREYVLGKDT